MICAQVGAVHSTRAFDSHSAAPLSQMSAKHVPHIAYDFVSAVADILHASRGHVERCHALPVSPALRSAFWAPGKLVLTSFCEAVDAAGGSDAIDW